MLPGREDRSGTGFAPLICSLLKSLLICAFKVYNLLEQNAGDKQPCGPLLKEDLSRFIVPTVHRCIFVVLRCADNFWGDWWGNHLSVFFQTKSPLSVDSSERTELSDSAFQGMEAGVLE